MLPVRQLIPLLVRPWATGGNWLLANFGGHKDDGHENDPGEFPHFEMSLEDSVLGLAIFLNVRDGTCV